MWKTRLANAATSSSGARNVVLSRDDTTFVISLDDWWITSAAQYLANKALRENNLNFKADELYGPQPPHHPTWTTDLIGTDDGHEVHLLRDGTTVATLTLEEFAGLSATKFVVRDAVDVASGLSQYGENIEEVKQHFDNEDDASED